MELLEHMLDAGFDCLYAQCRGQHVLPASRSSSAATTGHTVSGDFRECVLPAVAEAGALFPVRQGTGAVGGIDGPPGGGSGERRTFAFSRRGIDARHRDRQDHSRAPVRRKPELFSQFRRQASRRHRKRGMPIGSSLPARSRRSASPTSRPSSRPGITSMGSTGGRSRFGGPGTSRTIRRPPPGMPISPAPCTRSSPTRVPAVNIMMMPERSPTSLRAGQRRAHVPVEPQRGLHARELRDQSDVHPLGEGSDFRLPSGARLILIGLIARV